MAKSSTFREFEDKFEVIEREYDALLRISRKDGHKPIVLIAGEEKLKQMRNDLADLMLRYGNRLSRGERMEAVNAITFLDNTISIALSCPRS